MTLSPVKDIEWTKDSLRRARCRRVQTSGAERRPATGKQTAWDGQRTDVFLCKGHKHESFNSGDGRRAQTIVKESAKNGRCGEKSERSNRRAANAKNK